MTFHGLITGLVVLAILLGLAALESWRRSRRVLDYRDVLWLPDWTASLEEMVVALDANRLSTEQARVAFDHLGVLLADFRYWRDEWEWEQVADRSTLPLRPDPERVNQPAVEVVSTALSAKQEGGTHGAATRWQ